jgi:hypothetical protein
VHVLVANKIIEDAALEENYIVENGERAVFFRYIRKLLHAAVIFGFTVHAAQLGEIFDSQLLPRRPPVKPPDEIGKCPVLAVYKPV